jgi:hypothetical protein
MDVAVTDWPTSEMGPAGPTSAKSATLMKNVTIFVAKHTKNWAKNGAWEAREAALVFFSLHSASWSSSSACLKQMATETATASRKLKKKKNTT